MNMNVHHRGNHPREVHEPRDHAKEEPPDVPRAVLVQDLLIRNLSLVHGGASHREPGGLQGDERELD